MACWTSRLGWVLVVVALAWAPQAARAQDGPAADPQVSAAEADRADAHYAEAVRLFGQGRYREAVDAFDKAIAIRADAVYFCNRAVALIKLREWDEALSSMRTCRQWFRGPTVELAQVDAQLGGLEAFVEHVRPRALGVARAIATRLPSAQSPGAPPVDAGLVAADSRRDDSSGFETAGWVSLSVGGALLASAVTLDWLSADLRDDFVRASSADSRSEYNALKSELDTRQQLFYGLSISGGLLAATGVSLLGYHWLAEDEGPTSSHLVLTPHTAGAVLQLNGKF